MKIGMNIWGYTAMGVVRCDMVGLQIKDTAPMRTDVAIDLTSHAAGVYFVSVWIDQGIRTMRLVKEKHNK